MNTTTQQDVSAVSLDPAIAEKAPRKQRKGNTIDPHLAVLANLDDLHLGGCTITGVVAVKVVQKVDKKGSRPTAGFVVFLKGGGVFVQTLYCHGVLEDEKACSKFLKRLYRDGEVEYQSVTISHL